jgi:hypothetical protein
MLSIVFRGGLKKQSLLHLMMMMMVVMCNTEYDAFRTVHVFFKVVFNTEFQNLHLFPSSDVRHYWKSRQWLRLALSNGSSWVQNPPLLRFTTKTDPVSETLCLKQETICTVVFNSLLVLTRSPTTEIS